jgi:sterol 3beta-glucosyltransferase
VLDHKIVILTIGTLGDVQPYVALGCGLQEQGHTVTIATLAEFETLVTGYGLQFSALRGDFLAAARTPQDNARMNPIQMVQSYRKMARLTLVDAWDSAREAQVFIYNPAAFGGDAIAEKLGVPTFAAFPAPLYTPTREFPSPFFPFKNLGPFNRLSHGLFARLGPALFRKSIAEWRWVTLGLPPAGSETTLQGKPIPILYAYSPAVAPPPADWDDSAVVTGYWFLERPASWQPPGDLLAFLEGGPPPVYVGFGSMAMHNSARLTVSVLQALKLCGQRAVLASGWGGLTAENIPETVFVLDSAPHDWLFERVAAVVHHGGAGTTGAGLRAGRPTVVCPFVGDQAFWGRRVAALGVGPQPIPLLRLTTERLAAAIHFAVTDAGFRRRAGALRETIQAEDGVGKAVAYINEHITG